MKAILLIALTFFLAMVLAVVPLPEWALWARPEWLFMLLIYWTIALPERCGVLTAAVTGLLQDSLTGCLLGKHVLAYSLVITIALVGYKRLRMYDAWQQAGLVFLLLSAEQLIEYWVSLAVGYPVQGLWFLLPAVMGALLWPWILVFLRGIRRKAGMINKIA